MKIKTPQAVKQTLGPWALEVNKYGDYEIREGAELIAMTEHTSRANLIAYAPELLEAAKDLVRMLGKFMASGSREANKLRAAIKKAEGAK